MFIHSRETEDDSANEQQVRTALQSSMKPPSKHEKGVEKEKTEMQGKAAVNRIQSRRARKLALQQDVDKLKRKLRHEENVHRALERAFTRPLGALPRLPPYLPSNTLELVAEVAVLEEEVVRLEEQVVNYRQGLYQEAVYLSSLKNTKEILSNLSSDKQNSNGIANSNGSIEGDPKEPALVRNGNVKKPVKKLNSEDRQREENQVNTNSSKNSKQSPVKKVHRTRRIDTQKISDDAELEEGSGPNKLSEDVLKCLMSIYFQMSSLMNSGTELESMPSVSGSFERSEERGFRDPYGICSEFGRREIGLYKYFFCIEAKSIDLNLTLGSSLLARRLKNLLQKLTLVDLSGLTHEQKLAFWINMYNSCMMNASLEHGIPATPEMVVTLMPKAMVNVSGHSLSAMTIEHFILRFPYRSKHTCTTRGVYGLDWPEPLVTFALSCGSWSSPAVRVYTESQVYKQLEIAKRDYLQAAIGISLPSKLAIPKLLDWYLLDFAKDMESLVDWICLQLPSQLRIDAVKCFETGRRSDRLQSIQVLSYEFKFRYILAP